ncbi:MAG: cupin domain-containing protein [Gemmataceae bacterium]|nr:cupin domain-containing protein [Gemmataceae bacterium]
MNEPKLVPSSAGRAYSVVGDRYAVKVSGEDTGGAYALFDFFVPVGNGPPPHLHTREDEGFWITEGELAFYLGAEQRRVVARAGDYVHAARGVPHSFRNEGTVPARAVVQVVPAGLERFFAEVGDELPDAQSPPTPPGPEQIGKLLAAAPRYGLEIMKPAR